jgi:hypothetical protein
MRRSITETGLDDMSLGFLGYRAEAIDREPSRALRGQPKGSQS